MRHTSQQTRSPFYAGLFPLTFPVVPVIRHTDPGLFVSRPHFTVTLETDTLCALAVKGTKLDRSHRKSASSSIKKAITAPKPPQPSAMSSDVNLPGKPERVSSRRGGRTSVGTKPTVQKTTPGNCPWNIGQRVEARDSHGSWYPAKILDIRDFRLLIHFQRWR